MRQVLLVTGGAVIAVTVIVVLFALNQANQEQIELTARLQSRSQVLADSLAESIEPSYNTKATSTVQRVIDRFVSDERLSGLGVYDNSGSAVAVSQDIPLPEDADFITAVMDSDESNGAFVRRDGATYYTLVLPLHEDERVVGALAVVQNATYIDESIRSIWRDNIIRLLSQIILFAIAMFVLVRLIFFRSVSKLVESIRESRKNNEETDITHDAGFLQPLASEISKVTSSLKVARHAASEEARMRHEKIDTPWTAERLREFIKAYVKNRPIVVVSNREPYIHTRGKKGIEYSVLANGMSTALESVMEACGGTWIAHGSGSADKETADSEGKLQVPPDQPKYTLKRVWLDKDDVSGYYKGFVVEGLYPLCLMVHVRPRFRKKDWIKYREVNGKFAEVVLEEIRNIERPIVLVQDYHFALLPRMIKAARPDAQIGIFWHVPWPSAEAFSICPWRRVLLDGMLGADLIAFNTQQFCNNFIDTVGKEMESLIDFEHFSIKKHGHVSMIRPIPISIAFTNGTKGRAASPNRNTLDRLNISVPYLALGIDRLDYSKGLPERLQAIEYLLETHPEYREKFTLLQIAAPHREDIPQYKAYRDIVVSEANRINERFGTRSWQPIVIEFRQYSQSELLPLHRLANVCLVTSLQDSMNLVSKEFAAARDDEAGVLILSQFAGASRDLKGALVVNPYSIEEVGEAIHEALIMPKTEQHRRMKTMRAAVSRYNVYRWAADIIKMLVQLD
jgi:trehalose-6-phosphate synthase